MNKLVITTTDSRFIKMVATLLVASVMATINGCAYSSTKSSKPSLPSVPTSASTSDVTESVETEITYIEESSSSEIMEEKSTDIVSEPISAKATPTPRENQISETDCSETSTKSTESCTNPSKKISISSTTTTLKTAEQTEVPSERNTEPSEPQEERVTTPEPTETYVIDPNWEYDPYYDYPLTNTPTPSPTPTPTPEFIPFDTENAKSVANSAMRQAISDCCGGRVVVVTDPYGVEEPQLYSFAFDDDLISNQQKRASAALSSDSLGHSAFSDTYVPNAESCGSVIVMYDNSSSAERAGWKYIGFTKNSETEFKSYDDLYTCMYNTAYMLINVHCPPMAQNTDFLYFGYGFAVKPTYCEEVNGKEEATCYEIYMYVGANLFYTLE